MNKRILSAILVMLCLLVSACGGELRTPTTAELFENVMSVHNFMVTDVTEAFEAEEITTALIASQEDASYQIEYQEYPTISQACTFFDVASGAMKVKESENVKGISEKEGNYEEYYLLTEGVFYYVARIDNTVIYSVAYDEYSKDIKKYSEELGYFY